MAPVKARYDKRTDLFVKLAIGKFYPQKFKLQILESRPERQSLFLPAFSINEVANKMHSVLFGTSSMLSAVETGFGALACFLKPEVASNRKFWGADGWWLGGVSGKQ